MKSFAKKPLQWFNHNMKSLGSSVKEKLIEKYKDKDQDLTPPKRTDINILLNRVKLIKRMSLEKKYIFQQQLQQDYSYLV